MGTPRLAAGLILIAAISLSACGSQANAKSAKNGPTAPASSSPAWGTPAYNSIAAAEAAVANFSARNNQDVHVATTAPFPHDAYTADVGPAALGDPYAIALDAVDAKQRKLDSPAWGFGTPTSVYMPASTTWPKFVLYAAEEHNLGKPAPTSPYTNLAVFEQKTPGGPLFNYGNFLGVKRAALPAPLPIGADTAVQQINAARAYSLSIALMNHWQNATPGAQGFPTKSLYLLDEAVAGAWRASPPNTVIFLAPLDGSVSSGIGPTETEQLGDGTLLIAPASGGDLVLATYRLQYDFSSSTSQWIDWTGQFAEVFGGAHRQSLKATRVSTVAWFMPSNGGAVVPLGSNAFMTLLH